MSAAFARFGLVLMTDHACNLRCDYCYTGAKASRRMPLEVGRHAIRRAVRSIQPGGTLELGFFGGEPLLDPGLLSDLADEAERATGEAGVALRLGVTTNGTRTSPEAWAFLTRPGLDLAVSCDGLPEAQDRHRRGADGRGTSEAVAATLRRLVAEGRAFRVVMVVRPDTLGLLVDGVRCLDGLGVRRIEPSLDLWTSWTAADLARLEAGVAALADWWRARLPEVSVSWLDEKLALLAGVAVPEVARCGYGAGSIAVAPSGRLYPCERVIGEDAPASPLRLPGQVADGDDFLGFAGAGGAHAAEACGTCRLRPLCGATCPCSNYVRTGDPTRADGLLCRLERACTVEVARVFGARRERVHAGR